MPHRRRSILLCLGLTLVVLLTVPLPASAHEKWFVDGRFYPPHFELLFTLPVLFMIGLACAGVGSLAVIRHLAGGNNRFLQVGFLRYYDRSSRVILAVQTAISLIAIAVYLLIMGRGLVRPEGIREPFAALSRYWQCAPTLLSIGVGTSIAVLAFTEKLLDPALALAFLKTHPSFNVAHLIGLTWFTNERFILASGAVELTIGLSLISGILPRLVIVGMFVPFNLTLPFLPATELLGHLPIFAVMYVLFFLPPPHVLRMDSVESGTLDTGTLGQSEFPVQR